MTSDVDYYHARALEERDRAAAAAPAIATIHRDLAAKYEALAEQGEMLPSMRSGLNGMSDAQPA